MTVLSAVFCIAGFAVSAAALISGAFYLIAYRPYAKKKCCGRASWRACCLGIRREALARHNVVSAKVPNGG